MIAFRVFFRSVRHALHGLLRTFRIEHNFRLQVVAAIIVIFASFFFHIARWEAIVIILLCIGVLVLELLNTIVERLSDAVQPRLSQVVREVKDIMAGTVLLTSLAAVVIGSIIFLPYLRPVLEGPLVWLRDVLY